MFDTTRSPAPARARSDYPSQGTSWSRSSDASRPLPGRRPAVELGEAEVAVGDFWAHPELLGSYNGRAEMRFRVPRSRADRPEPQSARGGARLWPRRRAAGTRSRVLGLSAEPNRPPSGLAPAAKGSG